MAIGCLDHQVEHILQFSDEHIFLTFDSDSRLDLSFDLFFIANLSPVSSDSSFDGVSPNSDVMSLSREEVETKENQIPDFQGQFQDYQEFVPGFEGVFINDFILERSPIAIPGRFTHSQQST